MQSIRGPDVHRRKKPPTLEVKTMARKKERVLATGRVTVEKDGKVYTATYEILPGGVVRLETGQATHYSGTEEERVARTLLREIVDSGIAAQEGLERPGPR
jgi:hypothetical protein